jgi:hypothetical protein
MITEIAFYRIGKTQLCMISCRTSDLAKRRGETDSGGGAAFARRLAGFRKTSEHRSGIPGRFADPSAAQDFLRSNVLADIFLQKTAETARTRHASSIPFL